MRLRTGMVLVLLFALSGAAAWAAGAEATPQEGQQKADKQEPQTGADAKRAATTEKEEGQPAPGDESQEKTCVPVPDPMSDLLNTLEDLHRGPDDRLVVTARPRATKDDAEAGKTAGVEWREVSSEPEPAKKAEPESTDGEKKKTD